MAVPFFAPITPAILLATGSITSAQLKAIFDTPIPILPAPGLGKMNIIHSATLNYIKNTTLYGGGTYVAFQYGSDGDNFASNRTTLSNFLAPGNNLTINLTGWIGETNLNQDGNAWQLTSDMVNKPITFDSDANLTAGDGTINYSIYYSVVNA